jgi:hypothetical protein
MSGDAHLTVHGISVERWTARYGIKPFSHPCSECGRVLTTTIPFVQGVLRGLRAPECECGNEATPFGFVRDPAYGDLITGGEAPGSKFGSAPRNADRVRRL